MEKYFFSFVKQLEWMNSELNLDFVELVMGTFTRKLIRGSSVSLKPPTTKPRPPRSMLMMMRAKESKEQCDGQGGRIYLLHFLITVSTWT